MRVFLYVKVSIVAVIARDVYGVCSTLSKTNNKQTDI